MHEKHEPIELSYGKAKLSIPVTAKTRLWAWTLTAILALGLSCYQLWKQRQLEQRIESYAAVQDLLVKQLRECLGQPPIPQRPSWASNFLLGKTALQTCPLRPAQQVIPQVEAETFGK